MLGDLFFKSEKVKKRINPSFAALAETDDKEIDILEIGPNANLFWNSDLVEGWDANHVCVDVNLLNEYKLPTELEQYAFTGVQEKKWYQVSNDVRSKQFIKVFQKEDGSYESMIQRMYRQIRLVDAEAMVTIATSELQVPAIHNQLDESVNISLEPYRRDTFPAIALAVAYLHDVERVSENEPVVVCPVDPYVEADYFASLKELADLVEADTAQLMLLEMETASAYIRQGALWNGGVFAFKLGYQGVRGCSDRRSAREVSDRWLTVYRLKIGRVGSTALHDFSVENSRAEIRGFSLYIDVSGK